MHRLTIVLILAIFDLEYEAILETNILDYTIGVCLIQKGNNSKIRIVAFYARKMTGPKLNYNIHNKELLAIVETLRE